MSSIDSSRPSRCGLQDDDTPDVPAASELFGDEALGLLRRSKELDELVGELRAGEVTVVERAQIVPRDELLRAYAGVVADILSTVGIVLPDAAFEDVGRLFESVASLPFSPRTAGARRKAREVARIAMLADRGLLCVPVSAVELQGLWEQAMLGEPRWGPDHPSSAFRTGEVIVRGPRPERKVVHRCMDPREVPEWLDRLVALLADERLAPELRAACGLGLQDWIHPFADGNGHTGRLLMIAMLERHYSQPTLTCLAYELTVNRSATIRQFERLRNWEDDAIGFCLGMLGQVRDAQAHALSMLAKA